MTEWRMIRNIENGKKLTTKCGFEVKIYSASHENALSGIHGAVLVPRHPANIDGWTLCEWEGDLGKRMDGNAEWDLVVVDSEF